MEFKTQAFIVICKEPDKYDGYFPSKNDTDYLTNDIEQAEIFYNEATTREFISEYDEPEDYTYKPIEIIYRIKNLKLS